MHTIFFFRKVFFCLFYIVVSNSIKAQKSENGLKDSLVDKIEVQGGKEKLNSLKYLSENFSQKDPKLVLTYIGHGIHLAEELNVQETLSHLYRYKAISNSILGKMDVALVNLNLSMASAKSIKDTLLMAKSALSFGNYYNRLGDFTEAKVYYSKAKSLASISGDVKTAFSSDFNLATTYMARGFHKNAIIVYEGLYQKCPNEDIDCNGALLNIAVCSNMLGRPSEALDMLFEAKANAEAEDNQFRIQAINYHIAYLLESVGLLVESLAYYKEVLNYFSIQGELRQQATVNRTIGELLMKLGRNREAKIHLLESLRLQKENGLKTYAHVLIALGDLAIRQKEYAQAAKYFKSSEPLLRDSKLKEGIALLLLGKAQLCLVKKKYEQAEDYAQKALFISKKIELVKLQMESYEKLGVVFEKQDKFEEALMARDTLQQLNLGVADKSTALEVNQKLVRRKLLENEETILELEEKAELEVTSKKTLIIVISLLFLFLIGSILYLNRQKLWKSKFGKVSATLDDKEAEVLIKLLEDVMRTEQPYLNEDLTLIRLAELLPSTQKKLSVLLNNYLNTNFYDYINKFRITAFKSLLNNVEYSDYSTLGIANECGFKSKSSFYRIFKKETGQSPGEYKKQVLNKMVS